MWMRIGYFAVIGALAAAVAACGGGGGDESGASGVAVIGTAGGTVLAEDGAQVVFPKDALRSDTTVRIAMDSSGAPPLPPGAVAAGAVYAITPHGGAFDELVEVSIPVARAETAGDGQLLLVTAEPGDTQWRVLSGASYYDGKMRAPVLHFSFFQTIRLVDQIMPTLVTKIDGANNIGGTGIRRISALADLQFLGYDAGVVPINSLVAELSLPSLFTQPNAPVRRLTSTAPPSTTCRPVGLGHNAMSFRFSRERGQEFSPQVGHRAVVPREPWPRFPGDGGALTLTHDTTIGRTGFPGFGAIHYYGDESPRISGFFDANPPTQAQIDAVAATQSRTYPPPLTLPIGNVYALPSASDNATDNTYTWSGDVWWRPTQNGSVRIDAAIMTTCGLLLEAVPLAFKLAAPPETRNYRHVVPDSFSYWIEAAEGSDVTMYFGLKDSTFRDGWAVNDSDVTYRVDYSPNPTTVDWQPVPASAVTRETFSAANCAYCSQFSVAHGVRVSLSAVQASQAGFYRVFSCSATGCFDGQAGQLVVLRAPPSISAQPAGQTVQVGETASFTVATSGAPRPALQWQKRSFVAAAFGFLSWTNIDGATGATYTTPPLALADSSTQYRAWASNSQGGVASDTALLTVVERFLPPVIDAQPGNLNVTVAGTAVFAATVSGLGPLSYQWRRNGSNITGANSAILTLANVSALNDGRYDLVVSNRAGSVTTEPAVLQVTLGTPVPLAPTIAAHPASITVAQGNAANFAVAVTGTGPYTYMWMKNGIQAPIPNGDFPSLTIASVTAADAGSYTVRVTNSVGSAVSNAATLTVGPGTGTPLAPAITTPPAALAVLPGGGATFAVAVSGTAPFSYQWRRNGAAIVGATGAVLHIAAVNALDGGQYAVEVRNAAGATSSAAVPLIVIGAPSIVQQPTAASASEGSTATLSVSASGDALLYQWTRNQVAIAGATAASYTTPTLTLADSGAVYGVLVYNGAGLVFSQGAVLAVTAVPATQAPAITTQPAPQSVTAPAPATFSAAASGTPNPTWQWQLSSDGGTTFANINGATAASYTTPATATADSGKRYRALATNSAGSATTTVVGLTVNPAVVATAWQVAALIETDNAGDAGAAQVAVNATGQAVAVWQQSNGVSIDIYANRYTPGTGWGSAELIETDNTGVAQNAQVVVASSGHALAVWMQSDGFRNNIVANRYTPGTGWGSAAPIESGLGDAGNPQIAIDGSGNAIAVWWQHAGGRINIVSNRYVTATGWGSETVIESDSTGDTSAPRISADASGNAFVVWAWASALPIEATYQYNVWANRYSVGAGWGSAGPIDSVNTNTANPAPQVALDGSGNAIAVWHRPDGGWESIWSNRYAAGSGWGSPALIETDNTNDARDAAVAFDAGGNAFAVWTQSFGGVANVVANRYAAGIGWGTALMIETDDAGAAFEPRLVVDGNGNATAVWWQRNNAGFTSNIWTNRFSAGTGWGAASVIDSQPGAAGGPAIAIDSSGNITAVWGQSDGVRSNIWANGFR